MRNFNQTIGCILFNIQSNFLSIEFDKKLFLYKSLSKHMKISHPKQNSDSFTKNLKQI